MADSSMNLALVIRAIDQTKGAFNAVSDGLKKIGIDAKGAAVELGKTALAATATYASFKATEKFARFLEPGIKSAALLQRGMAGIGAELTGQGFRGEGLKKAMENIRESSIDISRMTGVASPQIRELQERLLDAAVPFEKLNAATTAGTMLMRKFGLSDRDVSMNLVRTASQFRLGSDQFGMLADNIAKAGELTGNTSGVLDMMRQMGKVAPSLGMGVEKSAQLVAILLRAGVAPRQAATGLQELFSKAAKAPGLKGIKDLATIVETVAQKTAGMDESDRLSALAGTYGMAGGALLNALLSSDISLKEINSEWAKGLTLQEKVGIESHGLEATIARIKNNAGEMNAALMRPLAEWLTAIADPLARVGAWAAKKAGGAISNAASGGAVGVLGIGAGATAVAATLTAIFASGALKKLGIGNLVSGGINTMKGITTGKIIEAATGVAPVYVTNSAEIGAAASGAGGSSIPGLLAKALPSVALGTAASVVLPIIGMVTAAYIGHKISMDQQLAEKRMRENGFLDGVDNKAEVEAAMLKARGIDVTVNIAADGKTVVTTNESDANVKAIVNKKRGSFYTNTTDGVPVYTIAW